MDGNAPAPARQLNPTLTVDVVVAAVTDGSDFASLQIASGGRASNTLAEFAGLHTQFGRTVAEVHLPTVTLDRLLDRYGSPDVVKIDIEGAELLALKGAERLLAVARPMLIVEVSSEAALQVSGILARHDYTLRDAETGEPTETCAYNCLAMPRSR